MLLMSEVLSGHYLRPTMKWNVFLISPNDQLTKDNNRINCVFVSNNGETSMKSCEHVSSGF